MVRAALEAVAEGKSLNEAALQFRVHPNTLRVWMTREKASGSELGKQLCVRVVARRPPVASAIIPAPAAPARLVRNNGDGDDGIERYKKLHAAQDLAALKDICLELLLENYYLNKGVKR